ncbi:MAG: IS30 family transposase [Bdellovibrionaceae bacterium]|nr:IS30 family transposase [Pseudobdellovibrionaceae bacterium]
MKKYRQLTFEDRIYIEVWRWESRSLSFMAKRLGVHASTICRELQRGGTGTLKIGYMGHLGESHRRKTDKLRGRKGKLVGALLEYVKRRLAEGWSPEQISGRLKLEAKESVSHETIYRFLKKDRADGGRLYLSLRHGHRRRKKRFSVPRVRKDIINRLHISNRPAEINDRIRIGDWERDLMFGDSRKAALLTFVERNTLLTVIRKVESKSPTEIAHQTIDAMKNLDCKSITNDNGFEFRNHEQESLALKIPIYFTNPYSSWEKGTCENLNGLVRQYFPKHSAMKEVTNETVHAIAERLNSRPRKTLGFQTPLEAFTKRTLRQFRQLKVSQPGEIAVNL